jgi:Leucine-rich repeat (LRR) protein
MLTNIEALAALSEVSELRLNNNQIKDISVLQHLKKLKRLNLQNNFIQDYSVLYSMQGLEYLYIDRPDKDVEIALEKYLPNTKIEYYGYRY